MKETIYFAYNQTKNNEYYQIKIVEMQISLLQDRIYQLFNKIKKKNNRLLTELINSKNPNKTNNKKKLLIIKNQNQQ